MVAIPFSPFYDYEIRDGIVRTVPDKAKDINPTHFFHHVKIKGFLQALFFFFSLSFSFRIYKPNQIKNKPSP